jgi:hypothetical protein
MDFLHGTSDLFQEGGLVMYPLLVCSVLVVAIALYVYQGKVTKQEIRDWKLLTSQ